LRRILALWRSRKHAAFIVLAGHIIGGFRQEKFSQNAYLPKNVRKIYLDVV
jgi:hypothetical protein